jgi:hypothetical protein
MLLRFFRIVLLLSIAFILLSGTRVIYRNTSQTIAARPLLLDPDRPKLARVGGLVFLGAWELGSGNQDFGGISALTALVDGRFVGTSDAGTLIGFGLSNNNQIDRPFIVPLPDAYNKGASFLDRDSESITYDANTGRFWVGYEGRGAVRRFSPAFARTEAVGHPPAMKNWSSNSGAEALVRLNDGRFIIFSEGYDRPDGSYEGLLYSGDPTESGSTYFSFGYRPPAGYKITDVTQLPDGRLLLLNRRISFPDGFTAIISVLDPAKIMKGVSVSGTAIATLRPPLLVDNMEGITTTQENGRTVIWMISDNNFMIWQRTILMKFALRASQQQATKKPEVKPTPGFETLSQ